LSLLGEVRGIRYAIDFAEGKDVESCTCSLAV
jgi:hypothetical protein